MDSKTNDPAKMGIDQLRKEVYRLRKIITEKTTKIKGLDAIVTHQERQNIKEIVKEVMTIVGKGIRRF